jgi:LuxR family maltose regulon positive regulatory protein
MPQLRSVAEPASSRRHVRPFELLEAKLAVPTGRPGIVPRPGLVNRLRAATSQQIVSLVAPAGYGKTTLLSQWAAHDERPFAWVSVDERDNDQAVLLPYLAEALRRAQPVESQAFVKLAGTVGSNSWAALARLASALASVTRPIVVVLDDVQFLSSQSAEAVAALARHVPERSTLVLSGRVLPAIPAARLRAEGRLLELGTDDLALSRREAHLVLRGAGVELDEADEAVLADRTEGWAAGLHLAGLCVGSGAPKRPPAAGFGGEDRYVADYFHFELLSRLSRSDIRFLTRSAVLDTMCGPLCDAVLDRKASARKLELLERSSLFIVPLDRRRAWYRYHHLFRGMLRAELERREPEVVPELNGRATAWCEANGEIDAAMGYAAAAGDFDSLARLVTTAALPAYFDGRMATMERWFDDFADPDRLQHYPAIAALGCWFHALRGHTDEAERWLAAAENASFKGKLPDGSDSIAPWLALLRAALCRNGVEQMRTDAETATAGLAPRSQWRPTALLLRGVAELLLGENDRADESLAGASELAARLGATDTRIVALSERSLLANAAGDHTRARELALAARAAAAEAASPSDYVTRAIELAVSARSELRSGSWDQARTDLDEADRVRPQLTHALPWYSVQTSLELARARKALLDTDGAWALLSEAESILSRGGELGVLASQANELRAELETLGQKKEGRASMLTAAELRLVPLLTTHLSFREIGERLHVSRNTVKTQAIAVYRKLGVSSRNDAIDRAAELGLVDPGVLHLDTAGR